MRNNLTKEKLNELKKQLDNKKVDIQINSKAETINLNKLATNSQIDIDMIEVYLNSTFDEYIIEMLFGILSSNRVSVSLLFLYKLYSLLMCIIFSLIFSFINSYRLICLLCNT